MFEEPDLSPEELKVLEENVRKRVIAKKQLISLVTSKFVKDISDIVANGKVPKISCKCGLNVWWYEGDAKILWRDYVFCPKCSSRTEISGDNII